MHPASALAVLLLPGLLLAAPTVAGPPAADDPALEARAVEADERTARRLLRLADGRVLRGETRRREGRWERRSDAGWQALPAHAVVAATEERSALAQLRGRRQALRRAEPAARVPLAAWLLETGLYSEGLMELHEVLVAAPDEPAALALLARDDLPVAVPAWDHLDPDQLGARARLREYGARSPLPLQELVLRELDAIGAPSEREALLAELLADLTAAHSGRRGFASLALRRLFPGQGAELLVQRALLDPVVDVRRGAALAVRDAHEPGGLLGLAAALSDDHEGVRTHAAEALGVVANPATAAALMSALPRAVAASGGASHSGPRGHVFVGRQISYVQDYDTEVATNAVIADPNIGVIQQGAVLDVRILGAGGYGASAEVTAIRSALGRVTGADVHDTTSAWTRWWKHHGADWQAEHGGLETLAARPDPGETDDQG